jgi:hypothetical protein
VNGVAGNATYATSDATPGGFDELTLAPPLALDVPGEARVLKLEDTQTFDRPAMFHFLLSEDMLSPVELTFEETRWSVPAGPYACLGGDAEGVLITHWQEATYGWANPAGTVTLDDFLDDVSQLSTFHYWTELVEYAPGDAAPLVPAPVHPLLHGKLDEDVECEVFTESNATSLPAASHAFVAAALLG